MGGSVRKILTLAAVVTIASFASLAFSQPNADSEGASPAHTERPVEEAGTESEPEEPVVLRVGYAGSPPFVQSTTDGKPEGLSIRVWRDLAERLESKYELERHQSVEATLRAVESGELDVAVGPISITAARAKRVEFTQPYFDSSIAIAAPPGGRLWARIRPLLSKAFLTALAGLLLVLSIVGTLTWVAERKANPEQFPQSLARGIGNGIWFAIVTMTTVGYGDRSPKTLMGRVVAGGWMLVAILMTSSLTAGIATALTLVGLHQSAITHAGELDGKRVAVVKGTLSESFPSRHGATALGATDLNGAVQLVTSGDADALVFDRPALEHYTSTHPDTELEISPRRYRPQGYGFAVPRDATILQAMNVQLLHMKEQDRLPTSGSDTP